MKGHPGGQPSWMATASNPQEAETTSLAANNHRWSATGPTRKPGNDLGLAIPLVKEELVENLVIKALVERVVAQRFLLSDFDLCLSTQQLLLSDLFLLNGSPVFLCDLQTGEIQTHNLHVVELVQFLGDGGCHQGGNVIPLGSDGDQFVLGEHRLECLQQRGLDDARIHIAIAAGDGAVNTAGFIRAQSVFDRGSGLDHLKILGERGEVLRPHLSSNAEWPDLLNQRCLDIQTRLARITAHLAEGGDHRNLAGGDHEQGLTEEQQTGKDQGNDRDKTAFGSSWIGRSHRRRTLHEVIANNARVRSLLATADALRSRGRSSPDSVRSSCLGPMLRSLLSLLFVGILLMAQPAWAADLKLTSVTLAPCDASDPGSQPGSSTMQRSNITSPEGASCYVLSGNVSNPGRNSVIDTDVYARILDRSGEPVLQNRTRVGSIGDVLPGEHPFALRLAVPAGTPGPFDVKNPRARGFSAPVRSRAGDDEELLPLEQGVVQPGQDDGIS